jgi:hypothetical protein
VRKIHARVKRQICVICLSKKKRQRRKNSSPVLNVLRQSAHDGGKFVSPTYRPPLPPGNIPGTHFCRPKGHSAAGRIMSMKNSIDTMGNRSRDFPVCSAVPQLTAPPRAPIAMSTGVYLHHKLSTKARKRRHSCHNHYHVVLCGCETISHVKSRTYACVEGYIRV